jgi:hypothetical protein
MIRLIDNNGYIWKPYQFSDDYFYCIELNKIEWIKYIPVKKILEV